MAGNQNGRKGPQVRSGPMITAAALGGAGVMLTLAALAVGTSHLLTATRRWMRELEVPPSDLAKLKWAQAKAAAAAGSDAWQQVPVNPRARAAI